MDSNPCARAFLVLRAQTGDRQACGKLLEELQRPLYRYLCRILPPDAAGDALQEAFVTICRRIETLREPAYVNAWAYRIASRTAFRMLGKQARNRETEELQSARDDEVEQAWIRRLDADALVEAMVSLSAASRQVLWLHYIEDRTLSEIASILAIPSGTAKSRLNYALAQLRDAARPG